MMKNTYINYELYFLVKPKPQIKKKQKKKKKAKDKSQRKLSDFWGIPKKKQA